MTMAHAQSGLDQTFATVAAARSFTDAGRQLGLSQSSVSEHIRRTEENVGRRLFVRDTHSLAMTPDGEACWSTHG